MVRISWDPKKSAANLAVRGFDFAFAASIFEGPTLERPDTRRDYGEIRIIAMGIADMFVLTVVYTDRIEPDGVERRIISARRSNRRERKAYQSRPQS